MGLGGREKASLQPRPRGAAVQQVNQEAQVHTPRAIEGDGGYPTITVDGKQKKFHLVVFDAFFPGVRGDRTIDHINRDPFDNRLSNLRPVTWSEQMRNRTLKPPS